MTGVTSEERRALAMLSFLADPADAVLGTVLQSRPAADVLAGIREPGSRAAAALGAQLLDAGGPRRLPRWQARIGLLPTPASLAAWADAGLRLAVPGDSEWPAQLDDLGVTRPLVLWIRGSADIGTACTTSVAVVGARAATAYGHTVAVQLGAELSEHGYTVVSGGAYGIDTGAHRGAIAVGGCTVAVLGSGLSYSYPQGQHGLFGAIAEHGALVSECPPDQPPTRPGFLIRNRLIAALGRGTVVVQAALRSGALNTAKHARELCRPVMAVPGPVTTEQSAGCHELIMSYGAACVTGARDVIEHVSPLGSGGDGPRIGPSRRRDTLGPVMTAVLEAVPAAGGRGPAEIAIRAGVEHVAVVSCLGRLAADGFVERGKHGWRAIKQDDQDRP